MKKHAHSVKFIGGGKANDHLLGSGGRDVVVGRQGDDWIHGGAGNDLLAGDDLSGGKFWGWIYGGCWHARGTGNDFLDGGAGSDLVLAGRGNDIANYTLQENLRSHDVYDGGKGFDTLQLSLTYGEARLAAVQADIAAFGKFLDCRADPRSDHGKTFEFKSFDLDARNFEALEVKLVNTAPRAGDDADATSEDAPLAITPGKLLANDADPDHLDVVGVVDADALSALGAQITLGDDGSLTYDPTHALTLQQLAAGATIVDTFDYAIADLASATSTATVQITVTGVNDAPVAQDDAVTVAVSSGGQVDERVITFDGAASAGNVDGYAFAGFSLFGFAGVGGSAMGAAATGNDNVGGDFDADGALTRVDNQDFALKSLSIAAFFVEPTVTIVGYNDGDPVAGAEVSLVLNAAYKTVDFGAAWASVDEVRFYGDLDPDQGMAGDYILIDNLSVASGSGGGAGAAEPIDIDVMANDSDVDLGAILELLDFQATSELGATISRNPDGTLRYDPSAVDEILALAPGESATDAFEYTVSDGNGGTDVATVHVELLGGGETSPFAGLLGAPDVDLL